MNLTNQQWGAVFLCLLGAIVLWKLFDDIVLVRYQWRRKR